MQAKGARTKEMYIYCPAKGELDLSVCVYPSPMMFEEKKNMSIVSASDHSLYVKEKKNVVG
jgi:hypothetical protein